MDVKKVLLVDDDQAVNFLNKYIINDCKVPAAISIAMQGREALNAIAASPDCPDIIFLDINMPVMDGFEFLEVFKEQPCYEKSKIYMLTSSLRDSDRERSFQYKNVVDYIEKPLSPDIVKKIFS